MLKKISKISLISIFLLSTISPNSYSQLSKTSAVIKNKKNSVEVKYATSMWRPASDNFTVRPGSIIRTGSLSSAILEYVDGTKVKIGSRTSLVVLDKIGREIKISSGNLWYKVTKKSYGMKIYAPSAVASILGTEGGIKIEASDQKNIDNNYRTRIKIDDETNSTINISNQEKDDQDNSDVTFVLLEGEVETTAGSKKFMMKPGDKISFSAQAPESAVKKNIGVANVKALIESSGEIGDDKITDANLTNKGDNSSNAMQGGGMIPAAKIISLKENMNVFRQMVETYYMDEGSYPSSINVLLETSKKNGYFRQIKNPFTSREGVGASMVDYTSTTDKFSQGVILYKPLSCTNVCSGYKILASLRNNTLLTDKGSQPYVLSNK